MLGKRSAGKDPAYIKSPLLRFGSGCLWFACDGSRTDSGFSVEKAFADSGLPFRVDIVDWAKLTENMQKNIKKEHIVIQEANVSETR